MIRIWMFFLGCFVAAATAAPVGLETPQGKLQGETVAGGEVMAFKGIPFALPPVGERRWKHAEPAPGWDGVRLATRFSPACIQAPYPEDSFFARANSPTSEDCLYLNVWAPVTGKKDLPVMVWIHGGGLTRGTGATPAYDGAALAEKGAVVVTINYRLGIFGYFTHPHLTRESAHEASGNYGTSDQVVALQWVRDNIAAFGGDPGNVTIFGESAGSFSVHHMMSTDLAAGLFHRAIGQSGSSFDPMLRLRAGKADAEQLGVKFAKSVSTASIGELRAMDAHELLDAAADFRFRPVVDGWIFDDQIYALFEKGDYNAVPLLVGFNAEEGTTLGAARRVPNDQSTYIENVRKRYGELADEFLELYPPDNLRRSILNAFRDGFATWGMQTWAMMMANTDTKAWLYYFTHWPAGEKLGAYHAAEIVYVFDNVARVADDVDRDDMVLADIMSDYWLSFARTGNPQVEGLPRWRPYRAEDRYYMEFRDGKALPGKDLLPGVWELHENSRNRAP